MSIGGVDHMLIHQMHFTVPRETAGKRRRLLARRVLDAPPQIIRRRLVPFLHEAPELGLDVVGVDHLVSVVSAPWHWSSRRRAARLWVVARSAGGDHCVGAVPLCRAARLAGRPKGGAPQRLCLVAQR